jgi:hypothetical protein
MKRAYCNKKREEFAEHTFMSNYFNPFCNFRLPTHKALREFFQCIWSLEHMLWIGVCPLQTIGHLKKCRGTYFETPHPFFSFFPWYPVWKIKSFSSLHKIMPLERGVDEGHIFQEHSIPRPLLCVKNQKIFEISAPIWGSLIWGTPPLSGHLPYTIFVCMPCNFRGKAW